MRPLMLGTIALCFALGCSSDNDPKNNANNSNANNSNNVNNANNANNTNNANNVNNLNNANNMNDGGDTSSADMGPDATADMRPVDPLSFFITSVGSGANGGNLNGLAGADTTCERFAAEVGAGGKNWRAYLSSAASDARDRIGTGPWQNTAGTVIAADVVALHRDGIAQADMLDQTGARIPANEHDILTGSDDDGTALANTCMDWTSDMAGRARVGHTDGGSWNSAHAVNCDEQSFIDALGAGRLYCFASRR